MSEEIKEPLIEHICGEFGFTVKWTFEYESSVNFHVYRVESVSEKSGIDVPMYWRKGSSHNGNPVVSIEEAEVYLDGFIKWDGCANIKQEGYIHFCGPDKMKEHCDMLAYLYEKAKDLLGGEFS